MSVPSGVRDIITHKKLQYCRFADTKQWQNMTKVALPEATYKFCLADGSVLSYEGVEYSFPSTAEWVKYFTSNHFPCVQSMHLIGPGELEQSGPDEVKAIWPLIYHAGMKALDTEFHHTGGGYYHETWKRKGDDWFLRDLKLQRTYFKSFDES
ncbi:hypothetical protein F5Y13DRAFT_190121 [Hypoxylon sp. FL1857]|nr:hypothetical protein F5Y13DRAFT_190121 [Hypoxylon sp. FL1857]